jgi:hypothetical protein
MRIQFKPTADKFLSAIRSGAYGDAEQLLIELRREVEACWGGASPSDRKEISTEITSLLEWARHTILAKRSHTQARLIGLTRQGAYAARGCRTRGVVELEG